MRFSGNLWGIGGKMQLKLKTLDGQFTTRFIHGYEHVAPLGLAFECNLSMQAQHALGAFGTLWHLYVSVVFTLSKLAALNCFA
ncbi:hypothetical protein GCM10011339_22560 [Echinicola rosea]|uniref:Uncharacterized protein n=1 Tax=Echinicola rosea TaxID=1807691 RepID=A0ABQ1V1I7_9BACT|nr:hypothetical protein GCM10011339_22560 [Echinicola rosea]